MRYTFGTTKKAADRLGDIARVFNPMAVEFLRKYISVEIETALDLGCGPGFTTDMIYRALKCKKVYGFDNSKEMLKYAKKQFKNCNFLFHDITNFPFPVKADFMYTRFLLSHMKNVIELVNKLINELNKGGLLFIEETEDIRTDVDVFEKYLSINRGLVASAGATLYVGKILSAGDYNAEVLYNEKTSLAVNNSTAAGWFYPNTVTIWEKEKYVLKSLSGEKRKHISNELLRIIKENGESSNITWYMRRILLRKKDG
ncbi:class I SAM-dependent methyltransferase [candidate division WOR-3 bacterium]|nr:class I SAM-dependent methyltransferase [candidate division WOR-3 bacterium]